MGAFLTRVAVLSAVFALGTWLVAWWTVPLVGAAWGLVAAPATRPTLTAAAGAALAWGAFLGWAALRGPVGKLATTVGSLLPLPDWALLAVTLLYPALLAGSAAVVMGAIRR